MHFVANIWNSLALQSDLHSDFISCELMPSTFLFFSFLFFVLLIIHFWLLVHNTEL